MNKADFELLKKIFSIASPSSFESELGRFYVDELSALDAICGRDVLGNASAGLISGQHKSRVLMLAHMDEVGFAIKGFTSEGLLLIKTLGNFSPAAAYGSLLDIHTVKQKEPVPGVVCSQDISLDEEVTFEDLYIDIGCKTASSAKRLVSVGDYAVWRTEFIKMSKYVCAARAADNKVGVFSVMKAMKQLAGKTPLDCSVFGVLSTMEESGAPLSSAPAAASKINPGVALVVDTEYSTDEVYPLDGGPILYRGPLINNPLLDHIIRCAKSLGISYQEEYCEETTTSTDLDTIPFCVGGIAAALIAIPVRYMHTSYSIFDIRTVSNTARLLEKVCESITNMKSFIP